MTVPPTTRWLTGIAAFCITLWVWAWLGLRWTPTLADNPQQHVQTAVQMPLMTQTTPSPMKMPVVTALLEQPVFYPDRRMHPYQPGAAAEAALPPTTLDFELTSTVVTSKRAFAVLRLPGGGNSVIARPGEPFEADPAWQVTQVDRTSAHFVNAQGIPVVLTIKPPEPAQAMVVTTVTTSAATAPAPTAATAVSPASSTAQGPVTAIRPMQENADLRARIEARRRQANANAQPARTQ